MCNVWHSKIILVIVLSIVLSKIKINNLFNFQILNIEGFKNKHVKY